MPDSPLTRPLELVRPTSEHFPSLVAALERGWDPPGLTAAEELAKATADPLAYLDEAEDRNGTGKPVRLPDGTFVPRLPSITRWLWDGEFAGRINLRWQVGTVALPPTCLGHIGYVVVPWKRRLGYATRALALLLPEAQALGLPFVEVTTDPDNHASQRVIEANGGVLQEHFRKHPSHGGGMCLRYRLTFQD